MSDDRDPNQSESQRLSLEVARSKANEWSEAYREYEYQGAVLARFQGVSPGKLLDMLENGKDDRGVPLNDQTWEALAEALYRTFGEIPEVSGYALTPTLAALPKPPDDAMIDINEVARLVGLSTRHVDRKVDPQSRYCDPSFPKPLQVSERRIRWRASEVNEFVSELRVTRRASQR